jgi:RNA polymerase sigma factor (sigma-70 family)
MSVCDLFPGNNEYDVKLDLKRSLEVFKKDYARAYDVLVQRYVYNCTLQQVADELGVSANRVRQIEQKGLRILKHPKYKLGVN